MPIRDFDESVLVFHAGFFELSSNRRDIWHGGGMAGVGQLRCDWNLCLLKVSLPSLAALHAWLSIPLHLQQARSMQQSSSVQIPIRSSVQSFLVQLQEVAAPAYARLLAEAAPRLGPCAAFYALWPLQPVQAPWAALTSAMYAELAVQRVVHTAARGGAWLTPDQAVYADGAVQRCLPCSCSMKH